MSTASQNLITVSVAGEQLGVFATRSGGETTAEVSKSRPGGMQPEEVYPAEPTTGDVTVSRTMKRDRPTGSDYDLARRLRPKAGKVDMVISEQPLDANGLAWGKPTVWTGLLTGVNGGDADANSNEVRMLELTGTMTQVV